MPFNLRKARNKNLYYVVDDTGDKYSKEPIPLARAKRQITALHINVHGNNRGGVFGLCKPTKTSVEIPTTILPGTTYVNNPANLRFPTVVDRFLPSYDYTGLPLYVWRGPNAVYTLPRSPPPTVKPAKPIGPKPEGQGKRKLRGGMISSGPGILYGVPVRFVLNSELLDFILKKYPNYLKMRNFSFDLYGFWEDTKRFLTDEEQEEYSELIDDIQITIDESLQYLSYIRKLEQGTLDINKLPDRDFYLNMSDGSVKGIIPLLSAVFEDHWEKSRNQIDQLYKGIKPPPDEDPRPPSPPKLPPPSSLYSKTSFPPNLPPLSSSRFVPPVIQPALPPKPTGPKPTLQPTLPPKPTGPKPTLQLEPPPDTNIPDYVEEDDIILPSRNTEVLPRLQFEYQPRQVRPGGQGRYGGSWEYKMTAIRKKLSPLLNERDELEDTLMRLKSIGRAYTTSPKAKKLALLNKKINSLEKQLEYWMQQEQLLLPTISEESED